MMAHIEAGNVFGLYTVMLADGRVFHDRDAFQVQDLIEKFDLVEVTNREERARRITEVVQRELGTGVEVDWTAADNSIHLRCVHGGREHATRIDPLADDEALAAVWCREILAAS